MIRQLTNLLQKQLNRAGVYVSRGNSYGVLADNLLGRRVPIPYGMYGFRKHETDCYNYYIQNRDTLSLEHSRSQLGQDLWVAFLLNSIVTDRNPPKDRFFVEFGALDGKTFSNTFFLERQLHWRGILAEPIPEQFDACKKNRLCSVDNRCVWTTSGDTLNFNVVEGANEFATISEFAATDTHASLRAARRKEIRVETVSLVDLLREHDAPTEIDYLSIDTEGSEFEILKPFDFRSFTVKIISVEHNHTQQRNNIRRLLEKKGFFRLDRSADYFDDIYLNDRFFTRENVSQRNPPVR